MGNMSYCRYRNTVEDLQDCYDNWNTNLDNTEETKAQKRLAILCKKIADEYNTE